MMIIKICHLKSLEYSRCKYAFQEVRLKEANSFRYVGKATNIHLIAIKKLFNFYLTMIEYMVIKDCTCFSSKIGKCWLT